MKNEQKKNLTGLLLAVILVALLTYFNHTVPMNKVKEYGIFERAYVIDREGAKGGVRLTYKFNHQGKGYTLNNITYRTDIAKGDSFYIKILKDHPDGHVIFYKKISRSEKQRNLEVE